LPLPVFSGLIRVIQLIKRYHTGSQVKAAGALTFGVVYPVDRNVPPGFATTVVAPASVGADAHADHESIAGVGDERGLSLEEKTVQ
jgi:hypothetical protein